MRIVRELHLNDDGGLSSELFPQKTLITHDVECDKWLSQGPVQFQLEDVGFFDENVVRPAMRLIHYRTLYDIIAVRYSIVLYSIVLFFKLNELSYKGVPEEILQLSKWVMSQILRIICT